MLELYHHHTSVCAAKVRIALAEKSLDWTGHYVDLRAGGQHKPEYLRLNPKGVVPTLVHDEKIIIESTVINEYIDETFPDPPLRPEDSFERAHMRLWTKQLDEGIHAAIGVVSTAIAFRFHPLARRQATSMVDPEKQDRKLQSIEKGLDSPYFMKAIKRFQQLLREIENVLQEEPWLCGRHFSLADIGYAPYIARLDHLQLSPLWNRLPRLAHWYERLKGRPAYNTAVVDWLSFDGGAALTQMQEKGVNAWPRIKELLTVN
jgi:glutathione S-transferase